MTFLAGEPPLREEELREFSKILPRCSPSEEQILSSNYHVILDKLIATAYDPSIHIGHRGAAINALCSLIGKAKILKDGYRLDQNVWFRIFSIFLDRSDSAKTKPLRQLLACLVSLLPNYEDSEREAIKDRALKDALHVLFLQSDHVKVKPALQVLSFFLSKGVVEIGQLEFHLVSSRKTRSEHQKTSNYSVFQWFLRILFDLVRSQEASIPAGQAACIVVRGAMHYEQTSESKAVSFAPIWADPLAAALRESSEDLTNFRSHLLPDLFKLDVPSYVKFLGQLGLQIGPLGKVERFIQAESLDDIDSAVLFMCLEVGKEAGIVLETINSKTRHIEVKDNAIYLPDAITTRVVEDAVESVRLSGLALIISSLSITRPLSQKAFRCLRRNIPHLFLETDANVRGEVLVFVQRLIDRVKAVVGSFNRATNQGAKGQSKPQNETEQVKAMQQHQSFVTWFLELLKSQLHPAAAYQRHISGLRSLIILAKSGLDNGVQQIHQARHVQGDAKWVFHESIFDGLVTRLLQDLLMDPFDDVRSFASSLLLMHPNAAALFHDPKPSEYLTRAEQMMLLSGRADHADGVSRGYAILFEVAAVPSKLDIIERLIGKLEETTKLANEDLAKAVNKFPMHGILASLRFILDSPTCYTEIGKYDREASLALHNHLVIALERVWVCVRTILCNDAPEGYMPEELEEDVSISTKDILSYCWRALKEASSLLRVVALKAPTSDGAEKAMLSTQQFRFLCTLTFTELAELRHRGAFSNVAQSFATCCSRARSLQYDDLLKELYEETLQCIKAKGSATTRRSAGLPSLMVGILGAAPDSDLFKTAIKDLLEEARTPSKAVATHSEPLPQVHALNCLRSIFVSAILGPSTEPYIAPVLSLAGECLTSDQWAIRNCGLMLFRALIDRLLGSSDSQNWSENAKITAQPRFSYGDFPKLLEIVIDLLTPELTTLESSTAALESVFPALKIIQRIPPPRDQRERTRDLVLRLCSSPHWHVRDMAARTYAGLVSNEEIIERVQTLLHDPGSAQNAIHGQLLCILYLVKRELNSGRDCIDNLTQALQDASLWLLWENRCPFTRGLFLDILNHIGLKIMEDGMNSAENLSWMQFLIWSKPSSDEMKLALDEFAPVQRTFALHILVRCVLWVKAEESYHHKESLEPGTAPTINSLGLFLRTLQTVNSSIWLQTLDAVVQKAQFLSPGSFRVIMHLLCQTSKDPNGKVAPEVLGLVRQLLVRLYGKNMKQTAFELWPQHDHLEEVKCMFKRGNNLPPVLIENTVQFWGVVMNEAFRSKVGLSAIKLHSAPVVDALFALIRETQSFDTRVAVVRSLANMPQAWKPPYEGHPSRLLLLKLKLLVYDLLNDDDEEIRNIATTIASNIIAANYKAGGLKDVVPLLASQRLIAHLLDSHSDLKSLNIAAITRMASATVLGSEKGGGLRPSASTTFQEVTAKNTALFAVEKQNLFIDPVREAFLWSQLLKRLPKSSIRAEAACGLCAWVKVGIRLLTDKIKMEVDGPLGWTSKPEVFTFGMRIFCAADVILNWMRNFADVPMDGGLGRSLMDLLVAGKEQKMHEMWLAKIEHVLIGNIALRLRTGMGARTVSAVSAALRHEVG